MSRPWRDKVLADRLRDRHAAIATCPHAGPYRERWGVGAHAYDIVCACGATVEMHRREGDAWVRTWRHPALDASGKPAVQPARKRLTGDGAA
jgi:hypothetical protein